MTNPQDDGEADDIAKQEAESVADAKRRLAKRSGTNPRDDDDAVVLLTRFAAPRKGIKETFREPDANGIRRAEYHYALTANECNMIAALSHQLAEAQAERDSLHEQMEPLAAAFNKAKGEFEVVLGQLAEAQGVIERQRRALQEIADFPYVGTAASQKVWGIARAALSQSAAMGTTK